MLKIYQRIGFTRAALFVMLTVGVLELTFGEKYGDAQGGTLFDGVGYINCVKNLPELLSEKTINQAVGGKVNRFAPSILVHFGIKLTGYDVKNASHIFWAYIYHNIFWVLLGTWAWAQIGKIKGLSERNKWLGLVLLFFSCAFFKMNLGYIPIMTDTAAFVCGLLLIYFYIHPSKYIGGSGLFIIGLFGAFTWQTLQIYAYILLFFPNDIKLSESTNRYLKIAVYSLPLLFFTIGFWTYYSQGGKEIFNSLLNPVWGQLPLYRRGFWVTVAFAGFFTFYFYKELYIGLSLKNLRTLISPNLLPRLASVAVLHLVIFTIHNWISPETTEPLTAVFSTFTFSGDEAGTANDLRGLNLFKLFFYPNAIHYPFEIIVSHAVYFGFTYVLAFSFFPQIAQQVKKSGPGMLLVFTASFVSLCYPESRIHTPFVPFVAFFTVLFINSKKWHYKHYIFIVCTALFTSKFWLTFGNSLGSPQKINEEVWLRFFMSFGTWVNMQWHAIHTLIFSLCVLWFLIHRKSLLPDESLFEYKFYNKIKSFFVKKD